MPSCSFRCGGRGEKKVLNAINTRTGDDRVKHPVPDPAHPARPKQRVTNNAEKLYILVSSLGALSMAIPST